MALNAADYIKVTDDTSALRANMSIKIVALENDTMELPYWISFSRIALGSIRLYYI